MIQTPSTFKLTPKQREALKLLANKDLREIMLYGGSRSGKTFLLCWALFIRAAKTKSRHVILRKNFNHAKRSLWLDTIPKMLSLAMPDLRPKRNDSDHFYRLANGSEVWIGGLDDKERTEKILGTEYSSLYFNETSQIDFGSIAIAKTRLAEQNELIKKCYYDSNPPTKSSWQYVYFEKALNPVDGEPLASPNSLASMLMNPSDNMENLDPEYLEMLKGLSEQDRNRFLYGLYQDESDGQVYHAFRREAHVQQIKRQMGVTYYIGMDFNVAPMTAAIVQVVNDQIQVFDEVFLMNSDTPQMISELKRRGYSGLKVIPDSTGANRKTSGASDFQLLREAGFQIMDVHNPFVTDRVNNVNRLLNTGKLIIDPKCKKLINDLERVVWKDNKLDQKTDSTLTHISDALGYACHRLMPLVKLNITPATSNRMM